MALGCSKIRLTAIAVVCMLFAPEAVGKRRIVAGKVLAANGETLRGAVVQLKDTRTLRVRSFISQKDGAYHFAGLDSDVDYEIFARYRDRTSPTKIVSKFDSSEVVEIDLVVSQ